MPLSCTLINLRCRKRQFLLLHDLIVNHVSVCRCWQSSRSWKVSPAHGKAMRANLPKCSATARPYHLRPSSTKVPSPPSRGRPERNTTPARMHGATVADLRCGSLFSSPRPMSETDRLRRRSSRPSTRSPPIDEERRRVWTHREHPGRKAPFRSIQRVAQDVRRSCRYYLAVHARHCSPGRCRPGPRSCWPCRRSKRLRLSTEEPAPIH